MHYEVQLAIPFQSLCEFILYYDIRLVKGRSLYQVELGDVPKLISLSEQSFNTNFKCSTKDKVYPSSYQTNGNKTEFLGQIFRILRRLT